VQQSGQQFVPSRGYGPGAQAAAPAGLSQPQPYAPAYAYPASAPGQALAQPYGQPMPTTQPFAQSYAQPMPAMQPVAQSYAPPMPAMQPVAQSYAPPMPALQPVAQSYAQPMPAMQPTAQTYPPPVPPPSGAPPVTQSQSLSPQQSAQQAHVRRAVGIARNLEQIIPGYQLAISLVEELLQRPKGQAVAGAQKLHATLQDAAFYHFATLGAIRRFLCGESTPEVIGALAVAINHLSQIHTLLRPQVAQLSAGAPPEMRSALANLPQALSTADAPLQQAMSAVQENVSAQVWETARAKALAGVRAEPEPEASV
jgi:hypothetical protein